MGAIMVSRLFLMLTYLNNWKIVERKYQFESDYNIGVEVLKKDLLLLMCMSINYITMQQNTKER